MNENQQVVLCNRSTFSYPITFIFSGKYFILRINPRISYYFNNIIQFQELGHLFEKLDTNFYIKLDIRYRFVKIWKSSATVTVEIRISCRQDPLGRS